MKQRNCYNLGFQGNLLQEVSITKSKLLSVCVNTSPKTYCPRRLDSTQE